jgi:putative RNA 2'-phosphotransferase
MTKDLSRTLSLVLRHAPEKIGITLDEAGWTPIDKLLSALKKNGHRVDRDALNAVVATNDKKRFTISDDGRFIRAAQGHSVEVSLGLVPTEPPAVLYHGTASASLDSIFSTGLNPRSRQQVHLSSSEETALKVGGRHGKAVVLTVDCAAMRAAGHQFYQADNGVWLTDSVPPAFLSF